MTMFKICRADSSAGNGVNSSALKPGNVCN